MCDENINTKELVQAINELKEQIAALTKQAENISTVINKLSKVLDKDN